ncbi:MAG: undecaprenyldiphospho-muramoylpentapeptide beta-N-acetylglucosaminyltransferase [Mycobacteriaceae bacterium]
MIDLSHKAGSHLSVVLAGGGTAGHIEPAMAVADALRAIDPEIRITALGTERGLECRLVPERGYDLRLIPPVPLPRKLSIDLFRLPVRVISSVRQTRRLLTEVEADVVVGFGGYVALPAYLAAYRKIAGRKIPVVIHEANARAGIANKVGSRTAVKVLAAVHDSGLKGAEVVGIPVRGVINSLNRSALKSQAKEFFGLNPDAPVLLVFGGSQGAKSLNNAVSAASFTLGQAGIGVLHAYGPKNAIDIFSSDTAPAYVAVPYLTRMDLAYAAADMVICRSGAMTVAEVSAVGLPAIYVPLPHGNGEQELNARAVVDAGGGLVVQDADLSPILVSEIASKWLRDSDLLATMGAAAVAAGSKNAADRIAQIAIEAVAHARKDK